jgi:Ca2+-transporting ATPase
MADLAPDAQVAHAHPGLTGAEAVRRLALHGLNRVAPRREEGLFEEFFESLREPLVLLLIGVGVLYAVLGELRDAAIILAVIITVAIAETWTEWRAGRAIAALSRLSEPQARVWRDGELGAVATDEIVPGDVIELTAGSRLPADGRLLDGQDLAVDESLVTGEAEAVEHAPREGVNHLLGGSLVVRGRGRAEVTATGVESTLGRIATLATRTPEPRTPLQRQMAELAKVLVVVALVASIVVPVVGVLAGRPPREMLLTGLTLAFATIPEELPILIVVVLGLGSLRLARRGAIVRRLVAAETLGATTIICTDKTGTLTQNRMHLAVVRPASSILDDEVPTDDGGGVSRLLFSARLASERAADVGVIDPLDAALEDGGAPVAAARLHPFDSARRLVSGVMASAQGATVGVKGAPEAVVARCVGWRAADRILPLADTSRARFLEAASICGQTGRVVAVASRDLDSVPEDRDTAERDLVLEGLLVFVDPVRPEVAGAIAEVLSAGIAVTMITGDQATTASNIAQQAGLSVTTTATGADLRLWSDSQIADAARGGAVFARTLPEDKLRIVRALAESGEVVAVTGDGVNDTPALRAAAIGVAMGRDGSDVAREVSDLVLTDDNFTTIAHAVAEGRRLFENLRKAIRFYLAVKVALILVSLGAALAHTELPFAPVQIVILELFMDLGASLVFVQQPAESDLMRRAPRNPQAPFLDRGMALAILAGGILLAALVGGCFAAGLLFESADGARTAALVAWLVGHSVLGAVMASDRQPLSLRSLRENPALAAWIAATWLFALSLLTLPPLRVVLHAGSLSTRTAVVIWVVAVAAPLTLDLVRRVRSLRKR